MKKLYIITGILTLTVGGIVGATTITKTQANPDPVAVVQQEQYQNETLDNHEARITNLEGDVASVQSKTDTPPIQQRQTVPAVVTTKPTTTELPPSSTTQPTTPVVTPEQPDDPTVVSYEKIPVPGTDNTNCKYTYSDGTTYEWLWERVEYNQGTKISYRSGICDDKAIGRPKSWL